MNILDNLTIREATKTDIDDIIKIWMHGVLEQGSATGETTLNFDQLRETFLFQVEQQDRDFKFWVCVAEDNQIAGWQSVLPFHVSPNPVVRAAFGQSSTYVNKRYQGYGIGKRLLNYALEYCRQHSNIRYVFGLVLTGNKKSLKMCDEIGFYNMGTLPKTTQNDFPDRDFLVYEI